MRESKAELTGQCLFQLNIYYSACSRDPLEKEQSYLEISRTAGMLLTLKCPAGGVGPRFRRKGFPKNLDICKVASKPNFSKAVYTVVKFQQHL